MNGLRSRAGLAVGRAFNRAGFDLIRRTRQPAVSLLGIRQLEIRTIVDVGANEGQFAGTLLGHFPNARVISFEPVPATFRRLAENAEKDGRITPINIAVGDANGEIEMFEHVDFTASSSLLKTSKAHEDMWPASANQRRIPVQVRTLDDALKDTTLTPTVLVKLDVQGYEDRVIRGAPKTLGLADAAIVEVDIKQIFEGQALFKDIVVGLDAHGLQYAGALDQIMDRDGRVLYFDAVFLRERA